MRDFDALKDPMIHQLLEKKMNKIWNVYEEYLAIERRRISNLSFEERMRELEERDPDLVALRDRLHPAQEQRNGIKQPELD